MIQSGILARRGNTHELRARILEPVTLSPIDRLHYGAICAFFGVVVGGLIALAITALSFAVVEGGQPYNLWLVGFSSVYFLVAGVIRGPDAADTIADSLAVIAAIFVGGLGIYSGSQTLDGAFDRLQSLGWSVAYIVGVALIVWLA